MNPRGKKLEPKLGANVADVARGTIAPRAIPRRPIDPWGDGVAASSLSGRDPGHFATSTRACER
jgi:hypothetical protein